MLMVVLLYSSQARRKSISEFSFHYISLRVEIDNFNALILLKLFTFSKGGKIAGGKPA